MALAHAVGEIGHQITSPSGDRPRQRIIAGDGEQSPLTPHLTPPPELITSRHPIAFGEGSDSDPESGCIKRPCPRDQPEGPKRSWRWLKRLTRLAAASNTG